MMRTSLLYKYCCCFFVLFLSLFILLNTYGASQIKSNLINQKKLSLYQQSESICTEFMQSYFSNLIPKDMLTRQLTTVGTVTGTRIWVTDAEGHLLVDTDPSVSHSFTSVLELDPDIFNYNTKSGVRFNDYFPTPMVMAESIS